MDSRKSIVLLLLVLPLLSGCVMPSLPFTGGSPFDSKTQAGSGVVIEHFGPDNSRAYSGEEVEFQLKVKNTGSFKVERGSAEILGLDQVWEIAGGADSMGEVKLLPPSPDAGTSGEEETFVWRYKAPDIKTGLEAVYNPKARFFYDYASSTVESVTLMPESDMKNVQKEGVVFPAETVAKSKSPISIDVKTSSPIRMYQERVEFPIMISVKNVGGGTVCSDIDHCKKSVIDVWDERTGWYKFNIEIDVGSMLLKECNAVELINVIGSREQTISCKVSALKPKTGFVQKDIKVTANYGYFIDKSTSVVVLPSPVLE